MKKIILSLVFICSLMTARTQTLRYVSQSATGLNDGSSWENAYNDLHEAIDSCEVGDTLWVATGTYTPDLSDRNISFTPNGIVMLGGFAGNETSAGQRNPDENPTVISGDLAGNDAGRTYNSENSLHVIEVTASGNACIIDGFHIAGGNANGPSGTPRLGGGVRLDNGSPTHLEIRNCIIRDNTAANGAGVYIYRDISDFHTVIIENCVFENNSCSIYGSAIYNFWNVKTTITNCTFVSNIASTIYSIYSESSTELYNSIFQDNSGINLNAMNSAEFTADHCIFDVDASTYTGITTFTNNFINTDALLNDEYQLLPGSPARDAGRNDVVTITTDLAGIDRIMNDTVDIGAYEFNTTPPHISVTTGFSETNDALIQAVIVFNEHVTGLGQDDFNITNGTLSGLTEVSEGLEYTINIKHSLSGLVTIELLPESVWNSNEIFNDSASASYTYTDVLAPSATLEVENATTGQITRSVTVTFSEAVTGLELNDFTVTNGTASNLQEIEAGIAYTLDATATADGEVTVTIPEGAVTDVNGIDNTEASAGFTYAYVSGISGPETENIALFPNPARDNLTITCPGFTRYELYTAGGIPAGRGTEKELVLDGLDGGIYYLKIIASDNIVYMRKLVVVR